MHISLVVVRSNQHKRKLLLLLLLLLIVWQWWNCNAFKIVPSLTGSSWLAGLMFYYQIYYFGKGPTTRQTLCTHAENLIYFQSAALCHSASLGQHVSERRLSMSLLFIVRICRANKQTKAIRLQLIALATAITLVRCMHFAWNKWSTNQSWYATTYDVNVPFHESCLEEASSWDRRMFGLIPIDIMTAINTSQARPGQALISVLTVQSVFGSR